MGLCVETNFQLFFIDTYLQQFKLNWKMKITLSTILLFSCVYFSVEGKELQDMLKKAELNNLLSPNYNDNNYLKKKKIYDLRYNICLTDAIKKKFWELVAKAVHANHALRLQYARDLIDREVFKKIEDCPDRYVVKWAEKENSRFLSEELISKTMSRKLTKLR